MWYTIISIVMLIAVGVTIALFFAGMVCFDEKFVTKCVVVIILLFGLMMFLDHQNVEASQTTEMTITHMDIVQSNNNTSYKISLASDDKSVSDVISITKEQYAVYNVGDRISVVIESGKTNGGEEFTNIKLQ